MKIKQSICGHACSRQINTNDDYAVVIIVVNLIITDYLREKISIICRNDISWTPLSYKLAYSIDQIPNAITNIVDFSHPKITLNYPCGFNAIIRKHLSQFPILSERLCPISYRLRLFDPHFRRLVTIVNISQLLLIT